MTSLAPAFGSSSVHSLSPPSPRSVIACILVFLREGARMGVYLSHSGDGYNG